MNSTYSGRSILQSLGVNEMQATLALQQIQLAPRESDPDAGATVVIVKAVQRGMNKIGCPVVESGRLDASTVACIRRASGPDWESKSWLEITKDIVVLRESGWQLTGPLNGLSGVGLGTQTGMLLAMAGILYLTLKYAK